VTKLSLNLCYSTSLDRIRYDRLIDMLKQTSNLQPLTMYSRSAFKEGSLFVQTVCSTIIDRLDQSKLRHLNIPIFHLDQLKVLLKRFTNLFNLTLCVSIESKNYPEIIDYVKTLMNGYSIVNESRSVLICLDERSKTSNYHKRIKVSD
jgi:hypothetical protein